MYSLNSKTKVDKVFKVGDLLKRITQDKAVKQEAKNIESFTLEYVLNPDTIHIQGNEQCHEIYIFRIKLKEKQVPEIFIKEFDKLIELHTYLLIHTLFTPSMCKLKTIFYNFYFTLKQPIFKL